MQLCTSSTGCLASSVAAGHNFTLAPNRPVEARYVRFAVTPARFLAISELQVLDSFKSEPFDLRLALPDGQDRSDLTRYNPRHTPVIRAPAMTKP